MTAHKTSDMASPHGCLISVITPTFAGAGKIADTVASVCRQRLVDIEHIVVDGGPDDGTGDLISRLRQSSDYPIRYLREPDEGIYDAMNKGIRRSCGRYLYFLCVGDRLRDGVLSRITPQLPQHDRGLVYGDVSRPDGRYGGFATRCSLARRALCHQAIFYGRGVFDRIGLYSLLYPVAADHEFNMRCFADRRVERRYVPEIICDFEGGGISEAGDPVLSTEYLRLVRGHLGLVPLLLYRIADLQSRARRKLSRLGALTGCRSGPARSGGHYR